MSNIMAVMFNGIAQLEYHRDKPLNDHQEVYLHKMDEKMAKGISLGDEYIQQPDLQQRVQFVAANLADAIVRNQEQVCAALMAYLAVNLPDLQQVKITRENDEAQMTIELVFDESYKKQVPVKFFH